MTILELIPELLASLAMLPCGIFMGYLMYFYQLDHHTLPIIKLIKFGPFLCGGIVAVITSIFHVTIKFIFKRYKYEHFYFIMMGLTLLGASEVPNIFIYPPGYMPLYIATAGHGVCYISSLTFINIRTYGLKYRFIKLSVPHIFYLLGVSTGATITWRQFQGDVNYMQINERIGMIIAIICSVIIIGCLINEIMQATRVYNYKRSLDPNFESENIFRVGSTLRGNTKSNVSKIISGTMYCIAAKLLTVMFFYQPIFLQSMIASVNSNDLNVFQVHWFGLTGLVISVVMLTLVKYKLMYMVSLALKLGLLMVLIFFCSSDVLNYRDIKIVFWILYAAIGFGFSAPDINILSYTNLTVNEPILAVGYACEMLVIGIVQYATLHNLASMPVFENWHALGFIIILILFGLFGLFIITNELCLKELNVELKEKPLYNIPPQEKCVCGRAIPSHQIKH